MHLLQRYWSQKSDLEIIPVTWSLHETSLNTKAQKPDISSLRSTKDWQDRIHAGRAFYLFGG